MIRDIITGRLMLMMAEDAGGGNGGDGGAPEGSGGGEPAPDAEEGKVMEPFDPSTKLSTRTKAKYESQLNPKYQKDDFRDIDTLDRLYEGYRRLEAENLAKKDAIAIPTAESSDEEIRAFFRQIGMPEKEEDYKCIAGNLPELMAAPMIRNFQGAAYSCGLTKGQAERMWGNMAATVEAFINVQNAKAEKLKENFDERYSDLLKDTIPDATRRKARIEEEKNSLRAFAEATGIQEYLDRTGLSINPEFTHKVAEWYSHLKPASIFPERQGQKTPDPGLRGIYRHG